MELQRARHNLEAKQQRHRLENLIQVVFKCIQIKEMHGTEISSQVFQTIDTLLKIKTSVVL